MEITELAKVIFQYGGTIIMAALFVWVFITDKTRNNKTIESHTEMLKALTESNNNIAKALDIISNNLITIDDKVDRNYTEIVKGGK